VIPHKFRGITFELASILLSKEDIKLVLEQQFKPDVCIEIGGVYPDKVPFTDLEMTFSFRFIRQSKDDIASVVGLR
jgi:hypothetical protein